MLSLQILFRESEVFSSHFPYKSVYLKWRVFFMPLNWLSLITSNDKCSRNVGKKGSGEKQVEIEIDIAASHLTLSSPPAVVVIIISGINFTFDT